MQNIDVNGVDLTSGQFVLADIQVSVGPTRGPGGLSRVFLNMPNRDNNYGAINSNGSTYTVSIGSSSETFNLSGGVFTANQATGDTLSGSNGVYTFTLRDGTKATFQTQYAEINAGPSQANVALLIQTVSPTGEATSYTYQEVDKNVDGKVDDNTFWCYRLQQVSSNRGYGLIYSYQASTAGKNDTWTNSPALTLTKVQAGGDTVTFSGGYLTATDAMGRTTTYQAPVANGVQTITRPSGSTLKISYDGSLRATSVSNGLGTWSYAYSVSGTTLTVTVTDPNSNSKTYTANTANGVLTSYVDPLGRRTGYGFDGYGRLISVTRPHGDVITYTYDENETSPRGDVTTTTWTPAGGGAAIVTHASYDASCTSIAKCNKPNSTTDGRGNVTNYTYDNTTGVLLTATKPAGATGVQPQTRYSYGWQTASGQSGSIYLLTGVSSCGKGSASGSGNCLGTSDEQRTTITYSTNQNLLPVAATVAAGDNSISSTQSFTYDANGNLLTSSSPLGAVTNYRYDASRELTEVVGADPDGSGPLVPTAVELQYDGGGRLQYKLYGTDNGGFSQSYYDLYSYDAHDRLITKSRGPSGGGAVSFTQYTYDNGNRLTCSAVRMNAGTFGSEPASACTLGTPLFDGPDQIIQVNYNADDTRSSVISGLGTPLQHTSVQYGYNTDGLLGNQGDGNGNKTCYSYDGFGRLTTANYPTPSSGGNCNSGDYEQYGYDANSNLSSLRKRDGNTYALGYDALNNITSGVNGDAYTRDNNGRLLSASPSNGSSQINFTYDALGRMASSSRAGISGSIGYQYDAAGDRTRLTWPDGFYVGYNYDALGRLTSVLETNINAADYHAYATYGYDSLGRLTASGRAGGTVALGYSYDGVSRLATISYAFPNSTYNTYLQFQYDEASQVVWKQYTNGAFFDWTPSVSDVHITYGLDGLNRVTSAGGGAFGYDAKGELTSDGAGDSFLYNAHNWMTSATTSGGTASLKYDALGRLYTVTQGSTATSFLYDGSDLIAEYDGSGNVLRRFAHGGGTDDVVAWIENASGTYNGRNYTLADNQGSIITAVNPSGAPLGFNTYDESGVPGGSNFGRFQYTGQAFIPEAGLYYYKARMYSPTLGRFLQTDPIGYGDGMNGYAYVHGDPVNGTDPTGLQCTTGNCDSVTPIPGDRGPQESAPPTSPFQQLSQVTVDINCGNNASYAAQHCGLGASDSSAPNTDGPGARDADKAGPQGKTPAPKNCAGGSFSPVGSRLNVPNGYYYGSASLGLFAGVGGQVSFITGIHVQGGSVVGSYSGFSFLAGAGFAGVVGGGVNFSDMSPLGSGLSLTGQLGGGPVGYSASVNNSGNYAGQSVGGGPSVANVGVAGGLSGSRITCHVGG